MFFFIIRKNILEIQVSLFSRKDFICIFIASLRDTKLERHINKKGNSLRSDLAFSFSSTKKDLRENGTG